MQRRHTSMPREWLFTDERMGERLWPVLERMPAGSGIIVRHYRTAHRRMLLKRVRRIARARRLVVIDEARGEVARVHNSAELRRALMPPRSLIFISPLYPTRSHPQRLQLPHMRAATLARLAKQPVFALGGMDAERYRIVQRFGFFGWGAIDAWLEGID